MAFTPGTLVQQSVPPRPPVYGLPQEWGYYTTDNQATVSASSYFNLNPGYAIGLNTTWFVGDVINAVCSDGNVQLIITAVSPNVTTAYPPADIAAGSVTTAMLAPNAVTAAKMANNTVTATQIANATITGTQIAATTVAGSNMVANTVTSSQLALNTIQFATVTGITPNTLYSAGTQLVAAPGAGNVIIPLAFNFNYVYATAQYTSGGAIAVQYNSTIHQGGQVCSGTLAAATFNGYTVNEQFGLSLNLTAATSATINQPLYLTCATGNFATGAGTITAYVSYIVVAAS